MKMITSKMISTIRICISNNIRNPSYQNVFKRNVTYIQGQSPEHGVREYFYFIDHQGMLFLDDARMKNFTSCFKDKKFLAFFFKRLRMNTTTCYNDDFPYLSVCGRERNFVRCDDVPIVFTKVIENSHFSYAHADDLLTVPFQPEKVFMNVQTGRVYHPAPDKVGGIGLVRSQIAMEFSRFFEFENGENSSPTHFTWNETRYTLDNQLIKAVILDENK